MQTCSNVTAVLAAVQEGTYCNLSNALFMRCNLHKKKFTRPEKKSEMWSRTEKQIPKVGKETRKGTQTRSRPSIRGIAGSRAVHERAGGIRLNTVTKSDGPNCFHLPTSPPSAPSANVHIIPPFNSVHSITVLAATLRPVRPQSPIQGHTSIFLPIRAPVLYSCSPARVTTLPIRRSADLARPWLVPK